MDVRILDLDGAPLLQLKLMATYRPAVFSCRHWAVRVRMACSRRVFCEFEKALASILGSRHDQESAVTLFGSGDFHHITLALLRRQQGPFNLLIIDKHPDWMRGVPVLHCGTWVAHALRLPQVQRIFHVGGEMDFDNAFRWMAPWRALQSGKITVIPAVRSFARGRWHRVKNKSLLGEGPATAGRLDELLEPYRADLARFPLYVSVDKDVLGPQEAVVNWDSGHLCRADLEIALATFLRASRGKLAGMDLLGDWSLVRVRGLLRRFCHWTEHPPESPDPAVATSINERANMAVLDTLAAAMSAAAA
jgi:hypothetical protein